MTFFPRIKGPVAPYSNVPIAPQNFQPSQFPITAITSGITTTITIGNSTNGVTPNYVVGQLVRIEIPEIYGAQLINGQTGYVLSLPTSTSVQIGINSIGMDAFIPLPFVAGIAGASNSNPCVLTVNKSFKPGLSVTISGVGGMTQLNGNTFKILANSTNTLTINVNSTLFGVYSSGGIATLTTTPGTIPQLLAIGNIANGQINSNGLVNQGTFIPGSFENISA